MKQLLLVCSAIPAGRFFAVITSVNWSPLTLDWLLEWPNLDCDLCLSPECSMYLESVVLCHWSLAFPLNFDIHHQRCGLMCTWWVSDEKVAHFHIQVWHIEQWKDARGVLVGKDSDIRTQYLSLTLSDTHAHTTLGQQHRWVLGKQAAAGGGKDHKAGLLAKFHHLLWIAWDAHSTATRGMSLIHVQ